MAAVKHTRTPVNMPLRHGHLTHRDAIWEQIRKQKRFTVMDIEQQTCINFETIKTYLKGLANAGYLREIDGEQNPKDKHGRYIRKRWELINDVGVDAPRVTKQGKPVTQGQAREKIWRAMKILGEFNWRELVATASTEKVTIKEYDLKDYLKHLHNAGYIIIVGHRKPGESTRYKLIPSRYTGPRPPMIQRVKQVFDPNLGKVVWPKEADQ